MWANSSTVVRSMTVMLNFWDSSAVVLLLIQAKDDARAAVVDCRDQELWSGGPASSNVSRPSLSVS